MNNISNDSIIRLFKFGRTGTIQELTLFELIRFQSLNNNECFVQIQPK